MKNFYQILGVDYKATKEEIKKAYKREALNYHPDRVAHLGIELQKVANEKLQEINAAYEVLSDDTKRANYDLKFNQHSANSSEQEQREREKERKEQERREQERKQREREEEERNNQVRREQAKKRQEQERKQKQKKTVGWLLALLIIFVLIALNYKSIIPVAQSWLGSVVPKEQPAPVNLTIGSWNGILNDKNATLNFLNVTDNTIEAQIIFPKSPPKKLSGTINGNRLDLKDEISNDLYLGTFDINATIFKGIYIKQESKDSLDFKFEINKSIITPHTRFYNTKISSGSQHYMISHKDGNLYYREGDSYASGNLIFGYGRDDGRYFKNTLVLKDVKAIYGSPHHSDARFAIQNDGTLWAWGNNKYGQVGDNSGIDRDTPIKILDNVIDIIYQGVSVFALKNDGTVYAWGANSIYGKPETKYAPEKLQIENVLFLYAINDNTVGAVTINNSTYQLGIGKLPQKTGKYENRVKMGDVDVAFVRTYQGNMGSYITKNGELYNWGDVTGNGTNIPQNSPVLVLPNVKQVQASWDGWNNSKKCRYALTADGKLYAVDIVNSFKYEPIASNVYLLNDVFDSYHHGGSVAYYTNDGSIYEISGYAFGSKMYANDGIPTLHYKDVALPSIKTVNDNLNVDDEFIQQEKTQAYTNKVKEIFYIIIMLIIGIIPFVIFFKLPEEGQKAIMKFFLVIIGICLILVTFGIFRGFNNWKNDR